ncbi:hypothetical protein PSTT_11069 [Puccinia striiformis]|uniref:Uncharacterized protein n=1 Tax=Puccinia striiformis TaxID=27350 RepID=A0A2S4V1T1_9BASI|nr:hypothetical protein PSTT_11069 [Puccinia striiformis]
MSCELALQNLSSGKSQDNNEGERLPRVLSGKQQDQFPQNWDLATSKELWIKVSAVNFDLMDPEMQCGLTAPAILERKNQANLTSGRFTKSVLKKGKSAKIASGDSCATVGKEANLLGYLGQHSALNRNSGNKCEPQQQNAKKSVCWRETLVEFLGPASEKVWIFTPSLTHWGLLIPVITLKTVDKGNEEQSTGAAEAGEEQGFSTGTRKVPLPFFLDFLLNVGIMLPDFSFTSILEPFWDSRAENAVLRRSDKLSLGGESYHGEEGMLLKFNEREDAVSGMKIGSTSPHETCKSSEEKEFETNISMSITCNFLTKSAARSGTEIINEEGRTDQAMQEEFLHQFRSLVLEDIPYPRPQEVYKKILEHEFQ